MKKIIILISVLPTLAVAQNSWQTNPYNFNNSQYNYKNSPYEYKNNPYNWENSQLNANSRNGIYDNQGNRIGYETRDVYGTQNIFDNNGNRVGYGR